MRGSSKTPPKYRKHKRSGQAVVTLSDKDFYLGPHGTEVSKLEYDRVVGEWLANGRVLPKTSNQSISVETLIEAYWIYCRSYHVKDGRPTDELASIKIAMRDTNKLYAKVSVADFGPLSLDTVRDSMIARGNSRGYINGNVNRIRRMFKWGVAKQLVQADVYVALQALDGLKKDKSAAREPDPVLPVSNEVVDATLEHCPPMVADMIRFQRLTGCRPGEVRTIKPSEIDTTHAVWRYTPGSHKMEHKGRGRVILIGPKAQAIIRPYLLRDENAECFERPTGGRFKRWNYNEQINKACDKAWPYPRCLNADAIKAWQKRHRWAPNRLRHSAATAIREEFGLEAAQTVLGHASADVTQVYAERDIKKAAEVMGKVG